jgi:hypothetical protein
MTAECRGCSTNHGANLYWTCFRVPSAEAWLLDSVIQTCFVALNLISYGTPISLASCWNILLLFSDGTILKYSFLADVVMWEYRPRNLIAIQCHTNEVWSLFVRITETMKHELVPVSVWCNIKHFWIIYIPEYAIFNIHSVVLASDQLAKQRPIDRSES